jgi:hypothetical protein
MAPGWPFACSALSAQIEIPLSAAQAHELIAADYQETQRDIQENLPDTLRQVRETFIPGITPAQWDLAFRGKLRPRGFYAKLGYTLSH